MSSRLIHISIIGMVLDGLMCFSDEYSLRSTKWTTMMDVPARHLIIENFDANAQVSYWSNYITLS